MTTVGGNSYLDALRVGQKTTTQESAPSGTLDQNAFLKLMTTQLKTQDPFDPVDNSQMVAQMAQFSTLAGTSEMNTSLKAMAADIAASRVGNVAGWIGKNALVPSSTATPLADGSYAFEADLPEAATSVRIDMVDSSGAVVHSEMLGAQGKGSLGIAWDGKAADGSVAATGPLKVMVTAYGANGAMDPAISTWTTVNGVQSPATGGNAKLVTPLGLVAPDEALRLA